MRIWTLLGVLALGIMLIGANQASAQNGEPAPTPEATSPATDGANGAGTPSETPAAEPETSDSDSEEVAPVEVVQPRPKPEPTPKPKPRPVAGVFGTLFNLEAGNSAASADPALGDDFFSNPRTITPAAPVAAYGGVKVKFW